MAENIINPVEVGRKLRELRGARTIQAVSSDLGISMSALTMYELGERVPRDEVKIKICRYYGVDIGIFFAQ